MATPRYEYPVLSAGIGSDNRAIVLRTAPRTDGYHYSVTLPYPEQTEKKAVTRSGGIDLSLDLTGVEATWQSLDGEVKWSGWLPHLDVAVSRDFLQHSEAHRPLWARLQSSGEMTLKTKLDLWQMLRPAEQPGSTPDVCRARVDAAKRDQAVGKPLRRGKCLLGEIEVAR